MTDKQLKKLKKSDLLALMIAQSKEIDRLRKEVVDLKAQLEDKTIMIAKNGSLAEASLAIFHVIEDTQKAADVYLENIKGRAGKK